MIELLALKEWLGDPPSSEDVLVEALEVRAVAFVQRMTGRFFGTDGTTLVEVLQGASTNLLWLNDPPASITTVEERQQIGDSWTTITAGDDDGYEFRGVRLLRKGGSLWQLGWEYQVTYLFGYAAGAEPGEVQQLVMDLVKLKYDERTTNLAVSQESVGPERYARDAFTGDLLSIPWVRETVESWRWRRAA